MLQTHYSAIDCFELKENFCNMSKALEISSYFNFFYVGWIYSVTRSLHRMEKKIEVFKNKRNEFAKKFVSIVWKFESFRGMGKGMEDNTFAAKNLSSLG